MGHPPVAEDSIGRWMGLIPQDRLANLILSMPTGTESRLLFKPEEATLGTRDFDFITKLIKIKLISAPFICGALETEYVSKEITKFKVHQFLWLLHIWNL